MAIKYKYRVGEYGYFLEVWPTSFKRTPNIGDMVESQAGRTLRITGITHKVSGVVEITLSRETGGDSPSGGGGVGELGPLEYIG